MKMSKTQWNLKISNYRNNIMIYNKNNYKLREIISKVCNNLQFANIILNNLTEYFPKHKL